jgi:hypothetical protein
MPRNFNQPHICRLCSLLTRNIVRTTDVANNISRRCFFKIKGILSRQANEKCGRRPYTIL